MLSLICAVVLMSSRVRSTLVSRALMFRPPMLSALFSRWAIQLAAALLAPERDSANTEAPRACGMK